MDPPGRQGATHSHETRFATLRDTVNDAAFYSRPRPEVQQQLAELQEIEQKLERSVERWGELEQLASSVSADPKPAAP